VRVLLDTHALLWWILNDPSLSGRARKAVAERRNTIVVSAVCAWEIATKFRIGKLVGVGDLVAGFDSAIVAEGFEQLPISVQHGLMAGSLPGAHKDPFDRMLIAQARAENIPIVSRESVFDDYGVQRIW
jgi:PIN domain nuclease of toxin-antitoxin system